VCHAHRLPLALTWIPSCYTKGDGDEITGVRVRESNANSGEKYILCIEETACYVNDRTMKGFVRACLEHHLEEGQGVAGKALQSNHPFFFPDVKSYDISEYPLVHHARKFGLNAAVSIRLRSTYTGDDDYILEFFLPVNMSGSSEQQLLLNNLPGTMQRMCKSLRTVSDAELCGAEGSKVGFEKGGIQNFLPMAMSRRNSQMTLSDSDVNSTEKMPLNVSNTKNDGFEADSPHEQVFFLIVSLILSIFFLFYFLLKLKLKRACLVTGFVHNLLALIVPTISMVPIALHDGILCFSGCTGLLD